MDAGLTRVMHFEIENSHSETFFFNKRLDSRPRSWLDDKS